MINRSSSRRNFFKSCVAAGVLAIPGLQRLAEAAASSSTLSRPSDLKITRIRCGYIRGGTRLFVKIHTNQDLWGCGEGVDATPGTYHLVQRFGRMLEGRNPLDVHRLYEELRRAGIFGGAQSGMYVPKLQRLPSGSRQAKSRLP